MREYSAVTPNLHRSPDGTLFIALVASPTGVRKKAIVIERQSGAIIGAVELSGIGGTFSATLTVIEDQVDPGVRARYAVDQPRRRAPMPARPVVRRGRARRPR